jgi:transposase
MKVTIAQYQFTQDEIRQLRHYRDKQRDGRLKLRFVALLLLADEIAIETVARVIGKGDKTIERWGDKYLKKGIDSLNSFNYRPKQASLTPPQLAQLVTWVKQTNPAIVKQVKAYIQEQFGVRYSVEAVRVVLRKQGLTRLRPKTEPGKPPSVEEQQAFVTLYKQLRAESAAGTAFLFLDGMHLVHQTQPGLCWGDPNDPPVVKTSTGRKRLNILGAYHPAQYSLVHVTGEAACNSDRVVELFETIEAQYPTAPEIIMFSDNATYFHSNVVRDWLEAHPRMWLLYLPPYAPNLNLIERFWKCAKKHLVTNTYYEEYKTFRAAVFQFLNHLDMRVEELKTLMVERFQIIHPQTIVC